MHSTPRRRVDDLTFDAYTPADPDDAAHAARLGAVVDFLVARPMQPALLLTLGRISCGMSQVELAEKSGLSRSQIARLEAGDTRCNAERSELLAQFTGVPAWALQS